jgi:2-methylcitrate dehydratase PrpD
LEYMRRNELTHPVEAFGALLAAATRLDAHGRGSGLDRLAERYRLLEKRNRQF